MLITDRSMMYSQLFETLYFHAEHNCKGKRLKSHVRFLLDEFANIGTIPDFEKKLSTMRKYEISCTIILQSLSQLKAMYEKEWEVLVDNCDSFLFLGCQGKTTLEYVNQKLGKTTIKSKDHSRTHGSKGSSSTSRKHEGRDLMTMAEIQQMPDNNCILFIRGMHPFWCTKFTLEKHKNYKYSADADDNLEYTYDPNKYGAQMPKANDNSKQIEEALECPDVNADRIARERKASETVECVDGEWQYKEGCNVSSNGMVIGQFRTIEETFAEMSNAEAPINLTPEAVYDRDYEFRTSKPFMLDLESLNLEDEDNGQMVIDEPDGEEMPDEPESSEFDSFDEEPDFPDSDFE